MTQIIMMVWSLTQSQISWNLKSMNKASGGDGIPVELFQILKDDAVKVLHSICQQIWKTQQWSQDWKRSVFLSNPKEGQCQRMFKLPHNCTHFTHQQSNAQNSPSQASIEHEPRTSRCSVGLRKSRGTRDQIANIHWIIEKPREVQKKSASASLAMLKTLSVWITTNCGKFFKRWEYKTA